MSRHRALVVEDHAGTLDQVLAIVRSLGHEARTAMDVVTALKAIEEEEFCYLLLDQELPEEMGGTALVSGGARVMEELRKRDDRRVVGPEAGGKHVTPIVVVSGYSREYRFVVKMFDQGADDFVGKPVGEHVEELVEVIKRALERSGRREHAGCAGLALRTGVAGGSGGAETAGAAGSGALDAATVMDRKVELVLDGGIEPGRTTLLVNGARRSVQDNRFLVLLRIVVAFLKGPGGWSSRTALGIVHRDTMTRLREAFEGCGSDVIEGDRRGNFRLNPAVSVRVEWAALEGHPDPGVQRVVGDWKRTRRG